MAAGALVYRLKLRLGLDIGRLRPLVQPLFYVYKAGRLSEASEAALLQVLMAAYTILKQVSAGSISTSLRLRKKTVELYLHHPLLVWHRLH